MGQLGLGVMINMLSGWGEQHTRAMAILATAIENELKVKSAELGGESQLRLTFEDDTGLILWDNGQSCCEHRYMNTDDNLEELVGQSLKEITLESGPEETGEWGTRLESQFLKIQGSASAVTVVNYNNHNGYYGGFSIGARPID